MGRHLKYQDMVLSALLSPALLTVNIYIIYIILYDSCGILLSARKY